MHISVNGAKLFFGVDGESLKPDGKVMRQKPTVIMVHGGPGGDHTVSKGIDAALTIATKRCTITLKIQERQNGQIGKVLGSIR